LSDYPLSFIHGFGKSPHFLALYPTFLANTFLEMGIFPSSTAGFFPLYPSFSFKILLKILRFKFFYFLACFFKETLSCVIMIWYS